MFWRKKKKPAFGDQVSELLVLVNRLGVERRHAVRVRLPQSGSPLLPAIEIDGRPLDLRDISIGGCLILDPLEILGPSVGTEVELHLRWNGHVRTVKSRVVSRVDHRRHIQFLSLSPEDVNALKSVITSAARGLQVRMHGHDTSKGPMLQAKELWSSLQGDTVVLEAETGKLAQVTVNGKTYVILQSAWPLGPDWKPASHHEVALLSLFLCNIPDASEALKSLNGYLEQLANRESA